MDEWVGGVQSFDERDRDPAAWWFLVRRDQGFVLLREPFRHEKLLLSETDLGGRLEKVGQGVYREVMGR
jgi:hypothetical protein